MAVYPITPNLKLTTTGMNEVLAEDMTLIDIYCYNLSQQLQSGLPTEVDEGTF